MSKKLIINGDDFGMSPGIDQGIMAAHQCGILTSTSVLICSEDIGSRVKSLRHSAPKVGIGLHLNLTWNRPIADPVSIPGLVGESGGFINFAEFVDRGIGISHTEVFTEFSAQFDRFEQVCGIRPDHLDVHQFVSVVNSGCFSALLRLACERNVPVRPHDSAAIGRAYGFVKGCCPQELAERLPLPPSAEFVNEALGKYPAGAPDNLRVDFYGANSTPKVLCEILRSLPAGVTELMCHPGQVEISSDPYTSEDRKAELKALVDPEVLATLKQEKIELISFGDLMPH